MPDTPELLDDPSALTEDDWRSRLSADAFLVLRKHGTERAFTGPGWDEKRAGTWYCAGCGQVLFTTATKYESGTGWPSFWQPASAEAVATQRDWKMILPRTEVHCARCEGHLGHVFTDGPQPTGKRYCMNGVSMTFVPDEDG